MKNSEIMDKSYVTKEQEYLKKELEEFTKKPLMTFASEESKEMSAEDLCEIFLKTRPELFNHIYKECKLIYENKPVNDSEEDNLYFLNEELNIAKAIIYDYGIRAKKIGEILVASSK